MNKLKNESIKLTETHTTTHHERNTMSTRPITDTLRHIGEPFQQQ